MDGKQSHCFLMYNSLHKNRRV